MYVFRRQKQSSIKYMVCLKLKVGSGTILEDRVPLDPDTQMFPFSDINAGPLDVIPKKSFFDLSKYKWING